MYFILIYGRHTLHSVQKTNGLNIRLGRIVRLKESKRRCSSSTVSVYGSLEIQMKVRAEPFVK